MATAIMEIGAKMMAKTRLVFTRVSGYSVCAPSFRLNWLHCVQAVKRRALWGAVIFLRQCCPSCLCVVQSQPGSNMREQQLVCPLVRRARLACFRGPRPRALRRPSSTRVLHTQNLRCRRHTHDTHTEPPLLHTRSLPTHAHTHCLTGECGTHHGGGASSRGSVRRIPSFFLPASRCVSQRKRPAGE